MKMEQNKRILLVHPEISRTKYNFAGIIDNEPLELEYLWTALENAGFEPHIWDGQVETEPFVKRLSELSPAAVYICGRTRQEGFMKEYACERLYRDARILSIYEGTSQLQVVAAMKGIASGAYLKQIESYDARVAEGLAAGLGEKAAPAAELQRCLDVLRKATDGYRRFYELAATEGTTSERFEHATRALTEVLAAIVMGYLLLLDSQRDARFLSSCQYFVREAIGQASRHIATLENC